MRKIAIFLVLIALAAVTFMPAHPARAMTYTSGSLSLDCDSFTASMFTFTLDNDNTGLGNEAFFYEVTDGQGRVIYHADVQAPLGPWTLNGTIPYSGTPEYSPLTFRLVSLAGMFTAEQVAYTQYFTCPTLPVWTGTPVFRGAPIPAEFVLRTLTCDTPVYDAPGGKPVANALLLAGQTWFMRASSVSSGGGAVVAAPQPQRPAELPLGYIIPIGSYIPAGSNVAPPASSAGTVRGTGGAWVEIFVGGFHNGFVPASCVR